MSTQEVRVVETSISPVSLLAELEMAVSPRCGGVTTFPGRMRDLNGDQQVLSIIPA